MWAWFYDQSNLLALPIVAMLIFMAVFVGAVVRTWATPRIRAQADHLAMLPLQDQTGIVPAGRGLPRTGGGNP